MHPRIPARLALLAILAAATPALADDPPDAGTSYRVPYKLSQTNHFVVRVKLNGKGPFNLVVDTGAPALYLSTEAAKTAGIEPHPDQMLSRVETLEIEGGAQLHDMQARVEDVFQLVGMNALGLPGVKIDGMLGFNVLARYRITIDPTSDRMTWTRLAHDPPDIDAPKDRPGAKAREQADVQALDLLGGVAKIAALFIGKQPEDQIIPRGFVGLELRQDDGSVSIASVLPDSPAATAELHPGDLLVDVLGRDIHTLDDVRTAIAKVRAGDKVAIQVRDPHAPADSEPREITVTAGEGL